MAGSFSLHAVRVAGGRALMAAALLACLAGCQRRVPAVATMPFPPPALLVPVSPPGPNHVSEEIERALSELPTSEIYREQARAVSNGKGEPLELDWARRSLDNAVTRVRRAVQTRDGGWPRCDTGPSLEADQAAKIGDALVVVAAARQAIGQADEAARVCLDGLRLATILAAAPGSEAETSAGQVETGVVGALRRLLNGAVPSPPMLQAVLQAVAQHRASLRPLSRVLQEGLTQAAHSLQGINSEEWAGAVRSAWQWEPHIVPRDAVQDAWTDWATLIEAAQMPIGQGKALAEQIGTPTNNIEALVAAPSAAIVSARARRVQDLCGLQLMTALALWYRVHNQWPNRLEDLVPGTLRSIPSDKLAGALFAYRRTANSYDLQLVPGT